MQLGRKERAQPPAGYAAVRDWLDGNQFGEVVIIAVESSSGRGSGGLEAGGGRRTKDAIRVLSGLRRCLWRLRAKTDVRVDGHGERGWEDLGRPGLAGRSGQAGSQRPLPIGREAVELAQVDILLNAGRP